jgi:hypothetical protein
MPYSMQTDARAGMTLMTGVLCVGDTEEEVAQLGETLRYQPKGHRFDSRW